MAKVGRRTALIFWISSRRWKTEVCDHDLKASAQLCTACKQSSFEAPWHTSFVREDVNVLPSSGERTSSPLMRRGMSIFGDDPFDAMVAVETVEETVDVVLVSGRQIYKIDRWSRWSEGGVDEDGGMSR